MTAAGGVGAAPKAGRVVPLVFGWVHGPLSMSMPLLPEPRASERVREPVTGVAIQTVDGWWLVDTGLNAPLVRDRAFRSRFWAEPGYALELAGPPEQDPLLAALALADVDPDAVVGVVCSHFHYDHVGGLRHFAGRVPVHAHRAEYDAAMADPLAAEAEGMFRIDWDDPRVEWRFLDGDTPLSPGLEVLATPGHTPGHLSVVVELARSAHQPEPGWIFACDAVDLAANLAEGQPVTTGFGLTPAAAVRSMSRLRALGAERGFPIVPGHDPVAFPAVADRLGVALLATGTMAEATAPW